LATVTKIRAKLSQHEKGGDDSAVLELLKNLMRMNDFIAEAKDKDVLRMNVEVGQRLGFPGLSLKVSVRVGFLYKSELSSQKKLSFQSYFFFITE
jgi:hypothetical protein